MKEGNPSRVHREIVAAARTANRFVAVHQGAGDKLAVGAINTEIFHELGTPTAVSLLAGFGLGIILHTAFKKPTSRNNS